jgi:hypothetical protein
VAPYRIENHTMHTFRILQTMDYTAVDGLIDGCVEGSGGTGVAWGMLETASALSQRAYGMWNKPRIHSGGARPSTTILPYNGCAYAWDEPLALHALDLERLVDASADTEGGGGVGGAHAHTHTHGDSDTRDQWVRVGQFTFTRLQTFLGSEDPAAPSHIVVLVEPQGPVR